MFLDSRIVVLGLVVPERFSGTLYGRSVTSTTSTRMASKASKASNNNNNNISNNIQ